MNEQENIKALAAEANRRTGEAARKVKEAAAELAAVMDSHGSPPWVQGRVKIQEAEEWLQKKMDEYRAVVAEYSDRGLGY